MTGDKEVCLGLSAGWNSYDFILNQQTVKPQIEIVSVHLPLSHFAALTLSLSSNLFIPEQKMPILGLGAFFSCLLKQSRAILFNAFPLCLNAQLKVCGSSGTVTRCFGKSSQQCSIFRQTGYRNWGVFVVGFF